MKICPKCSKKTVIEIPMKIHSTLLGIVCRQYIDKCLDVNCGYKSDPQLEKKFKEGGKE